MKKQTLVLAGKKLKQLQKQYAGFINVIVDNWRGNRFIFDTIDVRSCSQNCNKCPLYNLLKKEKEAKSFSSSLYPATLEDQKIFGPQPFLNCKTLNQYKNCYTNWLIKKTFTKKEIEVELKLIKNLRIIYSKEANNPSLLENKLKKSIIINTLKKTTGEKKQIIKSLAVKMKLI